MFSMFSTRMPRVPVLIIGIGGTGAEVLNRFRRVLEKRGKDAPLLSFLALDEQGKAAPDVPALHAIDAETDCLQNVTFKVCQRAVRFGKRQIVDIQHHPDRLYKISPLEFESFTAAIYRGLGYKVRRTKRSHDGGIDLVLEKTIDGTKHRYIVQCKHSHNPRRSVGVRVVRELCGVLAACAATAAILVTNTRFTASATKFLRRHAHRVFGLQREHVLALVDSYVVVTS
jgi:restriction endonuclease Mrr